MNVTPLTMSPWMYVLQYRSSSVALELKRCVGTKPTIVRELVSRQQRSLSITRGGRFLKVVHGTRVEYYAIVPNPFHNLYRIAADSTSDYVTHKAA